jgi:hypothetical protein
VTAALLMTLSLLVPAQQTHRPDAEGFIRHWVVLAPLAIQGESGGAEIGRAFFPGEGAVKPKDGATTEISRSFFTWKAHETSDYYIDFLQSFGSVLGEYAAGYAVTYVTAPEEMRVTLAMGSNDQGKVWLNGAEVLTFEEARTLEKDASRAPVTLVKGKNVVVIKVINEINNWQACLRFLRGETPVQDITISVTPE